MSSLSKKPIKWFKTASDNDVQTEFFRLSWKFTKSPALISIKEQERFNRISSIYYHRQTLIQKKVVINNILNGNIDIIKSRIIPLLTQLPLKTLAKANPFANNDSSDCHTIS